MKFDKNFYRKVDFWFSLGMAAVLLVFWSQIGRIKADTAKIMPAVIIVASWICCLAILCRSILTEGSGKKNRSPRKQTVCLLVTLAISIVLIMSMKIIGMYTSLFLTLTAISLSITFMEGNVTWKKVLMTIGYDLAVILVVYLLFGVFLNVAAPRGLFI